MQGGAGIFFTGGKAGSEDSEGQTCWFMCGCHNSGMCAKASITLTLVFPFNRNDVGEAEQCAWHSKEPCVTEEFCRYCLMLCLTAALDGSASLPFSKAKEIAVISGMEA